MAWGVRLYLSISNLNQVRGVLPARIYVFTSNDYISVHCIHILLLVDVSIYNYQTYTSIASAHLLLWSLTIARAKRRRCPSSTIPHGPPRRKSRSASVVGKADQASARRRQAIGYKRAVADLQSKRIRRQNQRRSGGVCSERRGWMI